jgi:uncharacterized membrane protein YccC
MLPQIGWLANALHPTSAKLAFGRATGTALMVGAIAGIGVITGRWAEVGMVFFGAAFSSGFANSDGYRSNVVALASQGLGAAAGLGIGTIAASSVIGKIVIATIVAMACGMVGAVGLMTTAFAIMSVIGVAFAQFGDMKLLWWQEAAWYLVGMMAIFVVTVPLAFMRRYNHERSAVADVFDASAQLLASVGSPAAYAARVRLATAFAAARSALFDYRIHGRFDRAPARRSTCGAMRCAQLTAIAAAALYIEGRTVPEVAVRALKSTAQDIRSNRFFSHAGEVPSSSPGLRSLASALAGIDSDRSAREAVPNIDGLVTRLRTSARVATTRGATLAGLRLAWCMGLATTVTCALHQQSHSYWLPLTVAVIVRPEYASVFVRSVNRVVGTLIGAAAAAGILLAAPSGWPVAVASAIAIGFAVLAAPKLYALSVVGITSAALLSACIANPDPVFPGLRVLDTLLGAAIAIVFGYLLWPGRHTLPDAVRLDEPARAAAEYLLQAGRAPSDRQNWLAVRDQAYRLAHESRRAAQAGLLDPPPVSRLAAVALPASIALEDTVDGITMLATQIDQGAPLPDRAEVRELGRCIKDLGRVGTVEFQAQPDPTISPDQPISLIGSLIERATLEITEPCTS